MRRWQDDPRFRCPHCQRLIYLTALEPNEHPMTKCEVVAICIPCQHVFLAKEWRKHHAVLDPSVDVDA